MQCTLIEYCHMNTFLVSNFLIQKALSIGFCQVFLFYHGNHMLYVADNTNTKAMYLFLPLASHTFFQIVFDWLSIHPTTDLFTLASCFLSNNPSIFLLPFISLIRKFTEMSINLFCRIFMLCSYRSINLSIP